MSIFQVIAIILFLMGYTAISLEHKLKLNKSAIAIILGGALWMLVSLSGKEFATELEIAGSEIFSLVIFLLCAMSLVEVLLHYKFFDIVRGKLFTLGLNEKKQFVVIYFIAFFLSAIIDNLTTTIVMIQIARKFFKGENFVISAAGIVIAANAGGAFSPIGDVTTIMLWLSGKFSSADIILKGFFPSLTLAFVSMIMLYSKIVESAYDSTNEIITKLGRSEKIIISLVFSSFALPLLMNLFKLPPYLGLLIGLGMVWVTIDLFREYKPKQSHLDASIESFIKKCDIASLKFFVGILLAVSALNNLHILEYFSSVLYGHDPSINRIILGNIGLGIFSSIVDNVPLTAIAIKILNISSTSLWVLMALTVGTGGSLLVIGSAAGVVAMGMVKELTFAKYFQIAFKPALFGFFSGISIWYVQYLIFG